MRSFASLLAALALACSPDGTGDSSEGSSGSEASSGDPATDATDGTDTAGTTDTSAATGTDTGETTDPASTGEATTSSTGGAGATLVALTVNLKTPALNPEDVDARTAAVAELIHALAPDVVLLQEVTEGGGLENRASVLADMTGYEWRWHQTHELGLREGVGVLSLWPILWDEVRELPHADLFGQVDRAVIGVGVDTPDGPLAAFSTHMTLDRDEDVRADQAVAALAFVDEHRGPLPGFFGGDTNMTPETKAMRVLRGEASHAGATGDLVDGWLDVYPGDPGHTYPSDAPEKRIDYVYAVPGEAASSVESCALHLGEPVDGVMASDHLAVSCTIQVDL